MSLQDAVHLLTLVVQGAREIQLRAQALAAEESEAEDLAHTAGSLATQVEVAQKHIALEHRPVSPAVQKQLIVELELCQTSLEKGSAVLSDALKRVQTRTNTQKKQKENATVQNFTVNIFFICWHMVDSPAQVSKIQEVNQELEAREHRLQLRVLDRLQADRLSAKIERSAAAAQRVEVHHVHVHEHIQVVNPLQQGHAQRVRALPEPVARSGNGHTKAMSKRMPPGYFTFEDEFGRVFVRSVSKRAWLLDAEADPSRCLAWMDGARVPGWCPNRNGGGEGGFCGKHRAWPECREEWLHKQRQMASGGVF